MPDITTSITFLKDLPLYKTEKPFFVFLSETDFESSTGHRTQNLEYEVRDGILIADVRGREDDFTTTVAGFEIVKHETSQTSIETPEHIAAYRTEVEKFLAVKFDAVEVICWEIRTRRNETTPVATLNLADALTAERPAVGAHIDNTADGGPQVILNHLTDEQKERLLGQGYRFRLINTWRPLIPVVEDCPLAMCDFRTVRNEDLIACDRVIPTRAGEVYYLKYSERHKWYWLDSMTQQEMIVMTMFDSVSGGASYCPHVPVANPNARANAPPRRSIEARSIVVTRE